MRKSSKMSSSSGCRSLFSSSKKANPFQGRGMDKFKQVYSELETMRATIAAREGVSTSDVWFMRGANEGDWIPVVVGKKKKDLPNDQHIVQEHPVYEKAEVSPGLSFSASESTTPECWVTRQTEQVLYNSQQTARKALKALTLFIMVAAAIADIFVALVAEFASSLVSRIFGSTGTRYHPSRDLRRSSSSFSAPNSPTYSKVSSGNRLSSSNSTPSSPAGKAVSTMFNSEGSSGLSSSGFSKDHHQQNKAASTRRDDASTFSLLFIVLVILATLSLGRTASALLASLAWFCLPTFKAIVVTHRSGQRIKQGGQTSATAIVH